MQAKNIIVFDSGLGGLSICRELIAAKLPLAINYISDNAAFPYGNKAPEQLIDRATLLLADAQQRWQSSLVVVACNTASTVTLPALREQLNIPVVGVVPAIKTAAAKSGSGCIGLLATPGTVARAYTRELIANFAADKTVLSVGSSELVEMIEAHIYGARLDLTALENILAQFDAQDDAHRLDTLVLGCTHFPLIANEIATLRPHWQLIDSGRAIAQRVVDVLGAASNDDCVSPRTHRAYFTKVQSESRTGMEALNAFLHGLGFEGAADFNQS